MATTLDDIRKQLKENQQQQDMANAEQKAIGKAWQNAIRTGDVEIQKGLKEVSSSNKSNLEDLAKEQAKLLAQQAVAFEKGIQGSLDNTFGFYADRTEQQRKLRDTFLRIEESVKGLATNIVEKMGALPGIKALANATGGIFGFIKNAFLLMGGAVGLTGFLEGFNKADEWFGSNADFWDRLSAGFAGIAQIFTGMDDIDAKQLASDISMWVNDVKDIVQYLFTSTLSTIGKVATAVRDGDLVGIVDGLLGSTESIVGTLTAAALLMGPGRLVKVMGSLFWNTFTFLTSTDLASIRMGRIGKLFSGKGGISAALSGISGNVGKIGTGLKTLGKNLLIIAVAWATVQAAWDGITSAIDTFKETGSIITAIGDGLATFAASFIDFFTLGLIGKDNIKQTITDTWAKIFDMAKMIGDFGANIWNAAKDYVSNLTGGISDWFTGGGGEKTVSLKEYEAAIDDLAKIPDGMMTEAERERLKGIVATYEKENSDSIMGKMKGLLSDAIGAVWNSLFGVFSFVGLDEEAEAVKGGIIDFFKLYTKAIKAVWGAIVGIFTFDKDKLKESAEDIATTAIDLGKLLSDWVRGIFDWVKNKFMDGLEAAAGLVLGEKFTDEGKLDTKKSRLAVAQRQLAGQQSELDSMNADIAAGKSVNKYTYAGTQGHVTRLTEEIETLMQEIAAMEQQMGITKDTSGTSNSAGAVSTNTSQIEAEQKAAKEEQKAAVVQTNVQQTNVSNSTTVAATPKTEIGKSKTILGTLFPKSGW